MVNVPYRCCRRCLFRHRVWNTTDWEAKYVLYCIQSHISLLSGYDKLETSAITALPQINVCKIALGIFCIPFLLLGGYLILAVFYLKN